MKKVVIIGAGPSGLTAANELLKLKEYEVTILEEEAIVGGISKTINYKNNRMDIGGHRFFSKDERIEKYWEDLMPVQGKDSYDDKKLQIKKRVKENGPDPEKENVVMLIRRRVSRILYLRKFFDYPIKLKKETFKNMGILTTIKVGFSYLKACIFKRKENTLEDFYINRFGKVLYQMFFEKYTEKVWGRHPSEISADWGKQRAKGLSIIEVLKDIINKKNENNDKEVQTSLIEEFHYPKYGPGQMWEILADRIEKAGGEILKQHKVEKIKIEERKIKSVVCNVNGKKKEILGDIFISSMPIKDLVGGMEGEKIPEDILGIADGLPYRDFITVGLLVKKLQLKNETEMKTLGNIVPDCWIYIQEPDVKIGRLQIFNNWSPYLVNDIENTMWIGLEYFAQEGDKYWNMPEEEFIDFAIKELEEINIIKREDVIDSHQEKIKKAYPAYFDTYKDFDKLQDYLDKFENLYCVGRNGQHRYNNMDHSMLTSIEAVNNIEKNIKDKSNIWKVNTEKEYHEERNEK